MNVQSATKYKPYENLDEANLCQEETNEGEEENSEETKSKFWILTALAAGVFFGLSNIFVGKASHFGIYSREVVSVGALAFSAGYAIMQALYGLVCRNRSIRVEDRSPGIYEVATGKINWIYCLCIMIDGVLTFFTGVLIILSFKLALYGNINQGLIAALFSLTSVYLAVYSWKFYGQDLNSFHFLGMLLMVTCALLISFSKKATQGAVVEVYGEIIPEISPVWGVLVGIITTLLFFCRTILIKEYHRRFKVDPMKLTMHSYIFQGIIMVFVVFSQELASGSVMRDNILGGGFGFLGNALANHATTKGYVGPAAALTNIQVVLQVLVNAFALRQVPNAMQIVACVCGICGSLSITIGLSVWKKLFK
ncbi:unnamed protein product [Moneuplotes crassus]|uniref:EamA domain-containing protein n=1 Tax=Euplotes crassus TaxID=5936 RepID=A0AAD1XHZ9_EUPCR|nr:unnamed protein product [Moneuplotes crassus]